MVYSSCGFFQEAGQQCCVDLKESIVTRVLIHMELEMGERFLFTLRRLQREGEVKSMEQKTQSEGTERSTFL